jgi:hypothetical protein
VIYLQESLDIEDIKYTKPESKDIEFDQEKHKLILVKVHGIQLGFFLIKKITKYGYKCHFFLQKCIRKFSRIILSRIIFGFSGSMNHNSSWYCTVNSVRRDIRHFLFGMGFRKESKFGNEILYKCNFATLFAVAHRMFQQTADKDSQQGF